MKIVINGISGKMGSFLFKNLLENQEIDVVAGISRQKLDLGIPIFNSFQGCLDQVQFDTLVDFSNYPDCLDVVKLAIISNKNVVSGTTGYKRYDGQHLNILAQKHHVGVIISPNYSVLTKELEEFLLQVQKILPNIEIVEEHGIHKKDKPSGTAKYFGKLLNLENSKIHSLRLPGILANHHIIFADEEQSFTLTHKINSRQAFITGIEHAIIEATNNKTIKIMI
ncbi:MAG: 4-hydroxy-tetrahydrodipicolinate reductase [Haloplasmataceae bacterium]|jgi:4-hydroxy-tetrahydrodipicolinate reductase|nr:4-hydroxy-tetrahydrodipicolinate reductase [Haloplasmataceae bacterium]